MVFIVAIVVVGVIVGILVGYRTETFASWWLGDHLFMTLIA
jgi:hypothetical protein